MKLDVVAGRLFSSFGLSSDRSGGKAVGLELEDLFGPAEVLHPVETKIPEKGAYGHRVADQGSRRGRDHDLTPVGDCRNPSSTVNVETDKANCCLRRLAGVDAHADANRFASCPWVRNECLLNLDRRGHAGARRRERREQRVALGVNLLAVVCYEAGPDEPMMNRENLRVDIP
jgi:hypothetical protein